MRTFPPLTARFRVTHREAFGAESEIFQQNAERLMRLAGQAPNHETFLRYKELEAAWLALAETSEWLEGKTPPSYGELEPAGN